MEMPGLGAGFGPRGPASLGESDSVLGEACRFETVRGKQQNLERQWPAEAPLRSLGWHREGGVRGCRPSDALTAWWGLWSQSSKGKAALSRTPCPSPPHPLALSSSRWEPRCTAATGLDWLEPAWGGAGFKSVEMETLYCEAPGSQANVLGQQGGQQPLEGGAGLRVSHTQQLGSHSLHQSISAVLVRGKGGVARP